MSDAPTPTAESAEAVAPAPRLLLVDDEPGLRTAVQAYLEDEGFEVTTAAVSYTHLTLPTKRIV